MQLDLLDYIARPYPQSAGFKEVTTSRDAAHKIESSGIAARMRVACLDAIKAEPGTCKEIAWFLGEEVTSVRPRISELKKQGLVIESGIRRKGQHVWKITAHH